MYLLLSRISSLIHLIIAVHLNKSARLNVIRDSDLVSEAKLNICAPAEHTYSGPNKAIICSLCTVQPLMHKNKSISLGAGAAYQPPFIIQVTLKQRTCYSADAAAKFKLVLSNLDLSGPKS